MLNRVWYRLIRCLLTCGLVGFAMAAQAGLKVYTGWVTLPPTIEANQRTVDFSTNTLTSENTDKTRLSYTTAIGDCNRFYLLFVGMVCNVGSTQGSVSLTATDTSLPGFLGNHLALTSGVNNNATSTSITFSQPTPYVGFLWGVQFNSENTQYINLTLENNSVVTLKNCRDSSNFQCVGAYVSPNWLAEIYNLLLGWLLGDAIQYYGVYVQYQPDNGQRIKKVEFQTYECRFCGLLSVDTSQTMRVDYLTYVDGSVPPHHLRISTSSASAGRLASRRICTSARM